jgi:hypothetical protein
MISFHQRLSLSGIYRVEGTAENGKIDHFTDHCADHDFSH